MQFAASLLLPSLRELDIRHHPLLGGTKDMTALVEWVDRHGDQLKHVSFDYGVFSPSTLAWIIKHLPNVVSLELHDTHPMLNVDMPSILSLTLGRTRSDSIPGINYQLLRKMTPQYKEPRTAEGEKCFCPKLERLVCSFAEGHEPDIVEDVVNFIEARRRVPWKGDHPISWLRTVEVNLDEGLVRPLIEELQRRGISMNDFKFIARRGDERSK